MDGRDDLMWQPAGAARADTCPACGFAVEVADDAFLGEFVWCENCGAELEVISLDPARLELFEEEEK